MGVVSILKDMWMTFVFHQWENMVSGLIQWAPHIVETWSDQLGLSVNLDKTGLVAFMRRRKLPGFLVPRLFGTILHHSMLVKYLGVILNSWLTWREHVDVKVRKAHNLLWAFRGGLWCDMGPGTQGGSLTLHLYH
jgi:hypothetical protein